MGKSTRTFTTDEAKAYLIQNFTPFSKDVAGIIERAFDEEWIDFFPRKGKVGGAFCCNLPMLKQSRVLTNFDGSLSDVVTLAHELGHAYHGHRIENHSPLNTCLLYTSISSVIVTAEALDTDIAACRPTP